MLVMLVAALLLNATIAAEPDPALVEKGQQVLAGANPKCTFCHQIAGKGNPRSKLDGVGARLSAEDIKAWIRTPKEIAEKTGSKAQPAMPPYVKEKLSDEDLEALTAYLRSLK